MQIALLKWTFFRVLADCGQNQQQILMKSAWIFLLLQNQSRSQREEGISELSVFWGQFGRGQYFSFDERFCSRE